MKTDITITIKPEQQENKALIQKLLNSELNKKTQGKTNAGEAPQFVFVKKSIDARHGQVKIQLRYIW